MKRSEINKNCPEEYQEWLKEVLDDIERRVITAKSCLTRIQGIEDLHLVEECKNDLESLAEDLY